MTVSNHKNVTLGIETGCALHLYTLCHATLQLVIPPYITVWHTHVLVKAING